MDGGTVKAYASRMYSAMERAERPDGSGFVRLKDNCENEEEYSQIIHNVHNDLNQGLPDDFTYRVIREMLAEIEDQEDIDDPEDIEADIYTSDLLDWLREDMSRVERVDDALKDLDGDGIISLMMYAQAQEKEEIYHSLVSHIRDIIDGVDDEN
jgi:hypothetical protein